MPEWSGQGFGKRDQGPELDTHLACVEEGPPEAGPKLGPHPPVLSGGDCDGCWGHRGLGVPILS